MESPFKCKHETRRDRGMTTKYAEQNRLAAKANLPLHPELQVQECSTCTVILVDNKITSALEPIGHAAMSIMLIPTMEVR